MFGGVALTSITYFILMKGIKGTAYAKESFDILNGSTIADFMENQVIAIALVCFIFSFNRFIFVNLIIKNQYL